MSKKSDLLKPLKNNAFIRHEDSLAIFVDGKAYTVKKDHINFKAIEAALKTSDYAKIPALADVYGGLASSLPLNGTIVYEGKRVYLKNADGSRSQLVGYEVEQLIKLRTDGFDTKAMEQFVLRIRQNPSESSRTRLYRFLEVGKLPITEDGHFLAYKVVRSNFLDKHSGTMDNSVGKVVEMPRAKVDDDDNRTCSSGLHACSKEYIKSFRSGGDKLVVVKINPADVVSIPTDYNDSKLRACRYEVIAEITSADDPAFFGKPVYRKS